MVTPTMLKISPTYLQSVVTLAVGWSITHFNMEVRIEYKWKNKLVVWCPEPALPSSKARLCLDHVPRQYPYSYVPNSNGLGLAHEYNHSLSNFPKGYNPLKKIAPHAFQPPVPDLCPLIQNSSSRERVLLPSALLSSLRKLYFQWDLGQSSYLGDNLVNLHCKVIESFIFAYSLTWHDWNC